MSTALGSGPRKSHYQVVIVGGGAIGLSIAYQLARRGITDVLVVDKDSLVKGATGRNGGGIRAQWTTEENILLAKRSIQMFKSFASTTGHNIFLRQGGYLFLTRSEAQLTSLRQAAAFQNQHGVRTRVIDLAEAERIVPGLSTEGCVGATFNPDDAVLFPWPLVWGWKDAATRLGVEVATFRPWSRTGAASAASGSSMPWGRGPSRWRPWLGWCCPTVPNATRSWSRSRSSRFLTPCSSTSRRGTTSTRTCAANW
jgi:glycine/D-amino acid oxidase-like deaminating enzyme